MKDELNKITPWIKECKGITGETKYQARTVSAIDLLVPERIDIVAKIKFLDYLEGQNNCEFVKKVYKAHLEAFCGGGRCSEPGDDNKNNFGDYVKSFKDTYANICNNGFSSGTSLIPVGKNNIIMDGSHRTASAIRNNLNIDCIFFDIEEFGYNYAFFARNMLKEEYLDYLVLEYSKLKKNTFVFCIWPKADKDKRQEAYSIIKKETRVIYEKNIDLSYLGYRNFIIQIYRNFDNWIGGPDNHYKGANSSLDARYVPGVPLKIFIVEAENHKKVMELKTQLRSIFGIGNFSIHSTDNQRETIYMLELLLNKNSLDLLNNGKPDNYAKLDRTINLIRKEIDEKNLSSDNLIVVSSSVMGLYGLRCPNDIDFIAKGQEYNYIEKERTDKSKYLSCQNHYSDDFPEGKSLNNQNRFGMTLDDLLYNPSNYLFYNGIKFVSLELLAKYKARRGSATDLIDIKAIANFRKNNQDKIRSHLKKATAMAKIYTGKSKLFIMRGLRRMHAGEIYHFIKGDRRNKQKR